MRSDPGEGEDLKTKLLSFLSLMEQPFRDVKVLFNPSPLDVNTGLKNAISSPLNKRVLMS